MKTFIKKVDIEEAKNRINKLEANDKAQFGKFSVDQMVCHLIDSLGISYGLKGEKKAEKSFYTSALGKWFVISSPFPWPKGKIKVPFTEFFETKPSKDFEEDKKTLLSLLSKLEKIDSINFTQNPGFGKLSKEQWARLHCRHMNHHLEQFGR